MAQPTGSSGDGLRTPKIASALRLTGVVGGFFALKILIGLALLTASARRLAVEDFVIFSQLFLCLALLATVSAGGVHVGLIRQVAAANGNLPEERRYSAAALAIWAGFSLLLLGLAILLREWVSVILIGSPEVAWIIPWLAGAASCGGGGLLLCSILTGRGRAPTSLMLQAVGLAAGGGLSLVRVMAGDPVGGVLGFAIGPIITAGLAIVVSRLWLPWYGRSVHGLAAAVRELLGFSGAFLVNASLIPITLFGLRYAYRIEFGAVALGYWLAGNRVSDVTSQLLGLYMSQVFLPQIARFRSIRDARPLLLWTFAAATALMASGWLLFVLGAPLLVTVFLSEQYLPAIPFIGGYLAGDILRVSASIALHVALARGRLLLYVGLEFATAVMLALFVLALTFGHRPEAAYIGYACAYATVGIAVWIAAILHFRRSRKAEAVA